MNLARFFQVTAVFLLIFVVQLLIYGFHELTEANIFPNSQVWHDATEPFGPDGVDGLLLRCDLRERGGEVGARLERLNDGILIERHDAVVLHHLREVERRFLFAELGYSSLFEYCISELKYSAGSAQRNSGDD